MTRRKKLLYEERAQAQAEQRYKELDARQQQKALADHLQQQAAAFRLQHFYVHVTRKSCRNATFIRKILYV